MLGIRLSLATSQNLLERILWRAGVVVAALLARSYCDGVDDDDHGNIVGIVAVSMRWPMGTEVYDGNW